MNNISKCSNKRRFTSENEARKERLFVEEEYSKKFRIYLCTLCQGWHFSTIN
jgi:hypothetical protein